MTLGWRPIRAAITTPSAPWAIPREISSRSPTLSTRRRPPARARVGATRSIRGCPPRSRAPRASHATAPASPPWTGEPPQPLTVPSTGRPTTACPHRRASHPPDPSNPLRKDPLLLVDTWLLVDTSYRRSCQDQLLRPVGIKGYFPVPPMDQHQDLRTEM